MKYEEAPRGPMRYTRTQISRIASLLQACDTSGVLAILPQDGYIPKVHGYPNYKDPFSNEIVLSMAGIDKEVSAIFNTLYTVNPFTYRTATLEEIQGQLDRISELDALFPNPGDVSWSWALDDISTDPHFWNLNVVWPGESTWASELLVLWDIYDSDVVFKHPLIIRDERGITHAAGVLSLVFSLP